MHYMKLEIFILIIPSHFHILCFYHIFSIHSPILLHFIMFTGSIFVYTLTQNWIIELLLAKHEIPIVNGSNFNFSKISNWRKLLYVFYTFPSKYAKEPPYKFINEEWVRERNGKWIKCSCVVDMLTVTK